MFGYPLKSCYVLREAGATIAEAGAEELGSDAGVGADAGGDVFDVGVDGFGQVGDGVDEGDLEGEEGVGGVLDDLGALRGGDDEAGRIGSGADAWEGACLAVIATGGQGRIDVAEDGGGFFVVGAYDDTVGVEEVLDSGAFAKELGVGDDIEAGLLDAVAEHAAGDPLIGVDGDSALFDKDLVAGDGAGDFADNSFDVGEVSGSRGALRGSDGDEDGLGGFDGGCQIGGEFDAAVEVLGEELGEVFFVDGNFAFAEGAYLGLVIVDADDLVADFSKADGRYQADVSGPDDADIDLLGHARGSPYAMADRQLRAGGDRRIGRNLAGGVERWPGCCSLGFTAG